MSPYRSSEQFLPTSYTPGAHAPIYAPPPFQFADFIRLLDGRRVLIFRVALATFLCGLAAALVLPTTYTSSSVVMLDPRKNNVTDLSAVLSPLSNDPVSVQNQIQIITSRDLAATVVDQQKLTDDPEFNPALLQPNMIELVGELASFLNPKNWFQEQPVASRAFQRGRVIENFLRHVDVDAQGLSTAITITVTSRDASKAAQLANALANAYVKSQVATKISATAATTD